MAVNVTAIYESNTGYGRAGRAVGHGKHGTGDHETTARQGRTPSMDRVDITRPANTPFSRVYDYEVSENHELIFRVVDAENRSKVIRQYPSEDVLKFRRAYRKFLETIKAR